MVNFARNTKIRRNAIEKHKRNIELREARNNRKLKKLQMLTGLDAEALIEYSKKQLKIDISKISVGRFIKLNKKVNETKEKASSKDGPERAL